MSRAPRRALTIAGLRVKRPRALPAQTVYFQDKFVNRVSETRNYGGSEAVACACGAEPNSATSLRNA